MKNNKIIKKTLSYKQNLVDYQLRYDDFSWQLVKKEIAYFSDGKLNAAYDAIDKNAQNFRKNKIALYWEGESGEELKFSFLELSRLTNRFANLLKNLGIKRGERVFIFLTRVPELYLAFLGIVKTGAIAGTLFSAFGTSALQDRLSNSDAKVLITDENLYKRIKPIRNKLPSLKKIILIDSCNRKNFLEEKELEVKKSEKDIFWFWQELSKQKEKINVAHMTEDEPAFMLYTSGTTGKPKGVVHVHKAIIHEHISAKWVLDIRDDDIYWCTADPGWVTGIAYEILGTWSLGASTLIYEGRFDPSKWYDLIQEYKVTVWYTAPTAIRMLAAAGLETVRKYNLSSLRHLCSVGEPLNPEAVYWGLKAFALPFHDNFWQTETGGIVVANYPCMDIKPGSMGKPLPGIKAAIVDDKGNQLPNNKEGNLALKPGWPSMMQKIWRRPKKYRSYFIKGLACQASTDSSALSSLPKGLSRTSERGAKRRVEWYITGDRAYKDKDGYFWFIGRADDVIKTAGERVGPFEVESALVAYPGVVEAGVIGKPDPMRGEIIKAFVVLKESQKLKVKSQKDKDKLVEELQEFVKKTLAGHAYPREIEFIDKLPKTRSGKIVRRVLKAKELGLPVGDLSTLEDY